MKTTSFYLWTLCLFFCLCLCSCSDDLSRSPINNPTVSKIENQAVDIKTTTATLISYIELKDNQYFLHLTKDQAIIAGIPEKEYTAISLDIEKTNKMILDNMQEDPDGIINLTDPQNLSSVPQLEALLVGAMHGGTINTDGQEEGKSDIFDAPIEANRVQFNCYTNARPIAGFTCRTYAAGEIRLGTTSSIAGIAPPVDVILAYSNVPCQASFQTTDNNGGKAVWQCKHVN